MMPAGIYVRKPRPARPIEWLKECVRCEVVKTLNDFYPDGSKFDGVHTVCKECTKADRKRRYREDPAKFNARGAAYMANPENVLRQRLNRYGLTLEQYGSMLAAQHNRCAACGDSFEGIEPKQIHIDHDHACCPKNKSCGECVRGVLCWHCNSALGMLRDEVWRVDALGHYMLRWES